MSDPTIPALVNELMEEVSWRTDAPATALQMRSIFTRLVTARVTAEQERDARLQVSAPRRELLAALTEMPDEAFGWFLSAARRPGLALGPIERIWPDGSGGDAASLIAIRRMWDAADRCIAAKWTAPSVYTLPGAIRTVLALLVNPHPEDSTIRDTDHERDELRRLLRRELQQLQTGQEGIAHA